MDSGISQFLLSTTSAHRMILDAGLLLQIAPWYQWVLLGVSGLSIGLSIARVFYFRAVEPLQLVTPNPTENRADHMDVPEIAGFKEKTSVKQPDPPDPPPTLPPPAPPLPELQPGCMFTSTTSSTRTAFIMDVSYSMNPDQLALSKEELKSAIVKLPSDSEYQVIFFSGAARFAHQSQAEAVKRAKDLPVEKWLKATPKNKKATLKAIDQVRKSRGTVWQTPIMMAMNLESSPDTIYFHTDGAKTSNTQLVDEIVTLVKQKGDGQTKIHTIALMAAKSKGAKYLQDIAERTGGEYKLVSNTRFLRQR